MKLPGLTPPSDLPDAGARIPAVVLRVALVLVGALLSLTVYGFGGWFVVGVLLSLAAAYSPQYLFGWALMLFLAAGDLAHHAHLSWRFLVLLAGLHLLQILATLTLELPLRSWLAPAVLWRPLRRWVVIQVPTQLLAVGALLLLAPDADGHRPVTIAGVAVIGALALAGLALLLIDQSRLDQSRLDQSRLDQSRELPENP